MLPDKRVVALHDIWVFADLINFRGGQKMFGQLHRDMTSYITEAQQREDSTNRRAMLLVSRSHLKSTVCIVLYSLWRIYRDPDIRILIGSADLRLGKSFIREMRQYLENDDLQNKVWNNRPHVKGPLIPKLSAAKARDQRSKRNNKDEFVDDGDMAQDSKLIWSGSALQVIRPTILKEPTISVVSVGTLATGDHVDLLLLDDIVSRNNSRAPVQARGIYEWVRDLLSVLDPRKLNTYEFYVDEGRGYKPKKQVFDSYLGDEIIAVGTRYYGHDYYSYVLDNQESFRFRVLIRSCYLNGVDETGGMAWPEGRDAEYIKQRRIDLDDEAEFAAQYLNQIIDTSSNVLSYQAIKWVPVVNISKGPRETCVIQMGGGEKRIVQLKMVVDPAVSTKANSDQTVICLGGYDANKELYIVDLKYGHFTPSQTIAHVFGMAENWGMHSVILETVGGFAMLAYQLREAIPKHFPISVLSYRPKGNKRDRIHSFLEPHFNNETIHMVAWMTRCIELRDELSKIGTGNGHDDILDSISIIAQTASPGRSETRERQSAPRLVLNNRWGGIVS